MDVENSEWDVLIIGAGMGGGTVGHALVSQGHRVLFVERGAKDFEPRAASALVEANDPEERIRNGRWPSKITAITDGVTSRFFAPMGCGVGGSTLLYAAVLERFDRSDFLSANQGRYGGAKWPVDYDDFLPYYERAERLYQVRGTSDPLNNDDGSGLLAPEPLNPFDASLVESFTKLGLHPYQMHMGVKGVPNCDQCLGRVCYQSCKSDARTICIQPITSSGLCEILDHCEVTRLEANRHEVQRVDCVRQGQKLQLRARVVILAAGAYLSPKLLLASRNEHWPKGIGNDLDQVGRNIMFHLMDMLAIWPNGAIRDVRPSKTICLRDFYRHEGTRLGLLQSMGLTADYGNILYALRRNLEHSRLSGNRPLWHLLRIPAYVAALALGRAAIFATVVEDMPYPANRVVLDPDEPSGIRVEYRLSDELRSRGRLMRKVLKQRLSGFRTLFLNDALELNFGHPCGSCRFGVDPATSVLDPGNRVHGLRNLYVVDSSFMPTSGGANPSLTIAANALRVADVIHHSMVLV